MKIKNINKFVRSILILLSLIIMLIGISSNVSFSSGDLKYKNIYVTAGDTIWNIAKQEHMENAYYQDKDIRDIVEEIRELNHLESASLKIGQELKIPTI